MDGFFPDNHDCVIVTSRLRVLWLRVIRGYTVDTIRRRPRLGRLGQIEYDIEWHLLPPSNSED